MKNENIKKKFIENECKELNEKLLLNEKRNEIIKELKQNIIKKINDHFQKNKENIHEWIELHNSNISRKKCNINYSICKRYTSDNYILYKIIPFKDSSELALSNVKQLNNLGEKTEILDYFPRKDNSDLIIYKDKDNLNRNIKINFKKDLNIENLNFFYDYDKFSDTLIICKEEKNIKKNRSLF